MTRNADVRFAKAIGDYLFPRVASKLLPLEAPSRAGGDNRAALLHMADTVPVAAPEVSPTTTATATVSTAGVIVPSPSPFAPIQNQEDAPPCSTCGSIMVRSGACYKCSNCGTTSGCA